MSALNSDGAIRAVQYLRMSSDNQRYSTENQQNAIAEYAEQHGYSIVASYIDAGKSGLSLKGGRRSNSSLVMRLRPSEPLTLFWFSMLAGGGGFKIPIKPPIMSSCAGRQACASSIAPSRSEKTLRLSLRS